jgi:NitT/TauT family transport system substrate-binding protein
MASFKIILTCFLLLFSSIAFAEPIRVGAAKGLGTAATMIAVHKGYYKQQGIDVVVEEVNSSSDILMLLATGRLEVIEGGIGASFFNAVARDSRIQIIGDRVSTPGEHKLLVRKGLKIETVDDVKGLKFANNAKGSISVYEMGKLMHRVGLKYSDLDERIISFPNMAVALSNASVDLALLPQPWASQFVEQNFADLAFSFDDYITSLTISAVMINTDWAMKNIQQAEKYYVATLKAVRDYCQAYHNGSNRQEVIDIILKSEMETRVEVLEKYPWPARNPNGYVNKENISDIQSLYEKEGLLQKFVPVGVLVSDHFADIANNELGSFNLENISSTLKGCR